jgi:lipoate-protein ligase A
MQKWRFFNTGSLSGPENMAFDDALLQSFDPLRSLPVLRLYGWSAPTLSLGRFQNAEDVLKLDCCRDAGVPVVRRISGGGVIYHTGELTYSIVCAPHHIPVADSIKETYRLLTGFLLRFYRDLGLKADFAVDSVAGGGGLGERTPFCFAGRESFDILVEGRKIGGNAQRRLKNVIFQHGSVPLIDALLDGVVFLRDRPSGLKERVTCLAAEGVAIDPEILVKYVEEAFCSHFNAEFVKNPCGGAIEETARELLREKYLNDQWNLKGELACR